MLHCITGVCPMTDTAKVPLPPAKPQPPKPVLPERGAGIENPRSVHC